MPGLAGPGQAGPQFGPSGPLTSLPGSELNLGQSFSGQVCKDLSKHAVLPLYRY